MRLPAACLAAVRKEGNDLRLVPESSLTDEICRKALASDGNALAFLPRRLRHPRTLPGRRRAEGRGLELCSLASAHAGDLRGHRAAGRLGHGLRAQGDAPCRPLPCLRA